MENDALQQCARQCAERAWRLAFVLMRDGHDADDVVQEAFVVAARRRDRIPTDDPWPWFATVVTNVARNARRSRRKHMHDDPLDLPAPAVNTELSVLVAEAMAQLPEAERDAVACTHLSGLTQAQAAEALEVPAGTVATRVRSGLAKLRARLGKRDEEVAFGIGIMLIPLPAGGMQVSTDRWLSNAATRASEVPTQGESMRSKLAIAVAGTLAVAILIWLGVTYSGDPGADMKHDQSTTARALEDSAGGTDGATAPEPHGGSNGPSADEFRDSLQPGPLQPGADGVASAAKDAVVRLGVGDVATMDPMNSTSAGSGTCTALSYEALYEIDPFDAALTRPLIAAGPVAFNSDFTLATVTIRDDVRFCDDTCFPDGIGRSVDAEDVLYSLKRALTMSPHGSNLAQHILDRTPFKDDADFDSIRVLDKYTIAFELLRPEPDFARVLSSTAFGVMAREAVEYYGDRISEHMVGTGPYVLEKRTTAELTFARNPNYRDVRLIDVPAGSPLKPFEGRRLPIADSVQLVLGVVGLDHLLDGRLSIVAVKSAELMPMLEEGQLELSAHWRNAGLKLFTHVTDGSHIVEFDMRNQTVGAPGGEKALALRRAISAGFDRKAWTDSALGYNGIASDSMVPPGMLAESTDSVPKADVENARRYLVDAGFLLRAEGDDWVAIDPDTGTQPELTFTLRGDNAPSIRKGEVMSELGRRIGIKIKVEQPEDWNSFVWLRMNTEGKAQMLDMGWSGGGFDPGGRFDLYASDSDFSSFHNEEYDRLVPKLQGLKRPGTHEYREALEALAGVAEILEREVPVFVIAYTRSLSIGRADLVRPSPTAGSGSHPKYWGIAEE